MGTPTAEQIYAALVHVDGALGGKSECWLFGRRYHFVLDDGWTVAISPDDADRFRLEACRWTLPRDTLWVSSGDHERLAELVIELSGLLAVR